MRIVLPRPFSVKEIAHYSNGRAQGDEATKIYAIATDSREVCEGDLFLAFRGEKVDGHDYIARAIEKGASAIMCERCEDIGASAIVCENTLYALGELGKNYHTSYKRTTVAVTGSVGKTTTKEFISAVLKEKFKLHKTEGNANSEIGMPLTLLAAPEDTEVCVVEMGMDGPGDIDYLSKIARPDLAVVTVIGSSHLEFLKTRENICRAKMEIVNGMKSGSEVIVNGDEALLTQYDYKDYKPVFACLEGDGEYNAKNIKIGESTTEFDFIHGDRVERMTIPAIGRHLVWGALYASIVASKLGMTADEIRRGLLSFKNVNRRQSIYNLGSVCILDDCYNAAPESMRAASDVLFTLGESKKARTLALLGDMRELGEGSQAMHEGVGEYVTKKGISLLFTFGKNALGYAEGARRAGMPAKSIFSVEDISDVEKCGELILSQLKPNDVLLVKASFSIGADRVIKYLAEHINM